MINWRYEQLLQSSFLSENSKLFKMVSALRRALETIKKLRRSLKKTFDFSHKKKNAPKRTLELFAIAVRIANLSSEDGLFCRVKYGHSRVNTSSLCKGDAADWKEHIIISTFDYPTDLIIECWRKKKSDPLKKFLGQIIITQNDLDEAVDGNIKSWYSLIGRGKKKEEIDGRIFVCLTVPGKEKKTTPQEVQQPQQENTVQTVNRTNQPRNTPNVFGVVDRLNELRPDIHSTVLMQEMVVDDFTKNSQAVERIVRGVDMQLRALEGKLKMLERRGTNLFLKQEIERLMKETEEVLEAGTKRIRQMGVDLNSTYDKDLQLKMAQFNGLLSRLMCQNEEFEKLCQVASTRGLITST